MKILFLTNNQISYKLYEWLKNEKLEDVKLYNDNINLEMIHNMDPDLIISYNYKYIIKKDVIMFMNNRVINLHISLLPWNRGASPNLWSFLENTHKGVTIHHIDEGLDTGEILLQKEIFFDESKETLKSSYIKLHEEIQELFKKNWNKIKNNNIISKPQAGKGSFHLMSEMQVVENIIDSWEINILELKQKYKELMK
ncbi:formyl transferase domain protein [Clostridium sp. DL-VIII]|uniref:formyltransferase family protein n=1 Tax=Clostridium sp. DL-VIII TaxID=641107 RepID=UPI00023B0631|nr:formyltransferase family protein [Clostridium sp. DL-VIII]EHJ01496.1 formyl transferase domain protein [Clostridium sp. DL-VIII]